ncbi:MAG: CoB--CoM heterodisulfide reductase iron-sulfur subunit B family protein [Synergistaceae bacterium]|nr:CoB--CoM heterodisulfide reductase iron-sulfur subunit B family protein [Synergistaceae bacterium]
MDETARLAAGALGVTLRELPEWQCCGAVYPMSKEEIAVRLSSVRALMTARDEGRPLLTLCSACHHVIKRVNHDMRTDEDLRAKTNNYLQPETPYAGETQVVHYLEMLRDEVGFDEISRKVTSPFKDLKVAAYYGCMLLRPSSAMRFDNPENPSIMENFVSAIGATPVKFPYRNECCGGYLAIEDRGVSRKASCRVTRSAVQYGGEALITACPLCLYNLKENGDGEVPVYYFTEFLAAALGLKTLEGGLARAS